MSFFPKIERGTLLAVLLYLILFLLFFARFLDGRMIIAFKDLSRYFYPLRYLMVEQARAGLIPLWNPYIFCGYPLLATLQIGFFYPLSLIYYLLPFNLAFNYYTIIHYFLAAIFMYALLRHYRLSRPAAFFGGLVFSLSGYLLSVSNMNTSLSSAIWLPLILLVYDKLEPRIYSQVPILAILLALMFLGGEPTILYVTIWFLAFYALIFSSRKIKTLLALFGAVLLAAGLSAVQLIPFLELARHSDRLLLTQFNLVSLRSFPIKEMITFLFPYFFGYPPQFDGQAVKFYQDWLISPYLGLLPLVFIFFAFKQKKAVFFAAAGLIALLLAFGRFTPLYFLACKFIPGVAMIRYPVKYLFLTTFCLTLLSAQGFERFLSDFEYRLKKYLPCILPAFAALILPALAGRVFSPFNLQTLTLHIASLILFVILALAAYYGKIRKVFFARAIIIIAAVDLFIHGYPVMIGASEPVFSVAPENYSYLHNGQWPYRFYYTPRLEKENSVIYGETYSSALFNAKDNFAANWHIPYHFFDFYGYESIRPLALLQFIQKYLSGEGSSRHLRYLSQANVKYVASVEKLERPGLKLLRHKNKNGFDVYLYENKYAWPRAYLKGGRAEITEYRPGKISLSVSGNKPGLLFLSEAYYPGWKFYVDGREEQLIIAEDIFSAVSVPAGNHEVKYVYEPLSFKIGSGISLLTILGVVGVWFWGKKVESRK